MSSISRRRREKTPPRTPVQIGPFSGRTTTGTCSNDDDLSIAEVTLLEQNGITRAQLRRALSFVDVTGDGKITSNEISGALMATNMEEAESQELIRMLTGAENVDDGREEEVGEGGVEWVLSGSEWDLSWTEWGLIRGEEYRYGTRRRNTSNTRNCT